MREEGDVEHSVETLSGGGVCYTVFEGSSEEDVAHSKVFWSSIYLQPPIESSLETVDIGQRLRRAKAPQRTQESQFTQKTCSVCNNVPKQLQWTKNDEILQRAYQLQMQDEKQRYMEMAKKRAEIMALLKKQREDRIKKEMVSRLRKPNTPQRTKRYMKTSMQSKAELIW